MFNFQRGQLTPFPDLEEPKIYKINVTISAEEFKNRGTLDMLQAIEVDDNHPVTLTLSLNESQFLEIKSQIDSETVSRENKVCSCDIMVLMAKGCQCGTK